MALRIRQVDDFVLKVIRNNLNDFGCTLSTQILGLYSGQSSTIDEFFSCCLPV